MPPKISTRIKIAMMAVVVGAACWVAGCAKKSGQTDVPETPDTLIDRREWDWKTYRTVKIGNQTWMAENLNYQTESGSWCYKDSSSYCNEYGRLYDWNAAMKACPVGYHLPSRGEWDSLSMAVGAKRDSGGVWDRSIGLWYTDDYGFWALPGGYRYLARRVGRRIGRGDFYDIEDFFVEAGYIGYWWTTTEHTDSSAYNFGMDGELTIAHKNIAFSVRCLKDADRPQSTSPQRSVTANKSNISRHFSLPSRLAGEAARWVRKKFGPEATPNTLTDNRDGKVYRTVKMPDGKTWTAENLNYHTPKGSWCYENSTDSCNKYGRLYDWYTAKKACPTEYHLPIRQEWDALGQAVGGERRPDEWGNIDWNGAGKKLKAKNGWSGNGDGTDDFGFSALSGGRRYYQGRRYSNDDFSNVGKYGYWWTATEHNRSYAYYRTMDYDNEYVDEDINFKHIGFSVRCVGD